jgi:WD40 repeat protein
VAFGHNIGSLQLLDLRTGMQTLLTEGERPVSIAISPDGKWLACGNWSGEVGLWDMASQTLLWRFRAHHGLLFGLAFSPDGQLLATGGNDQLIRLWQAGTTNLLGTFQGHLHEIWSLSFSSDGQKLISSSEDGTAKMWSVTNRRARRQTTPWLKTTSPGGALPDGSALLTIDTQQRTSQLWSVPDGICVRSFEWSQFEQQGCPDIWFFPANQVIVGRATNGAFRFWSIGTGVPLRSIPTDAPRMERIFLSRDNRWLLGDPTEGGLVLYDLRAGRRVRQFPDYWGGSTAGAVAFSPDGHWLAYAATNYSIKVWDLAANREKATLVGQRWKVDPLQFSPDGKLLASGGWDAEIWLWSVDTGKPLLPALKGHQSGLDYLVFSSDGKTLISHSDDQTIRWWSVSTGKEMLLLENARMVWDFNTDLLAPAWDVAGKHLLWRDQQGLIRLVSLPSLSEVDAAERGRIARQQR